MITRSDALNDALERLAGHEFMDASAPHPSAPAMPCHGPMAAEALSMLGHNDLVGTWVEAYKARHEPLQAPPQGDRIDPSDDRSWQRALGDMARVADWDALFANALDEQPWQTVVQTWLPTLLPGSAGAMTHGILRVAHAVRGLPAEGPAPDLQLREVARGLAYWAATYTALPGRPVLTGSRTLQAAIAEVPRVSPDAGWTPLEAGSFRRFGELPDFAGSIEALGPPESAEHALSDLSAAFCRVLLAHPDSLVGPLVHMVTPIAAARTLAPYLLGRSVEALYAQLWHVGAAITSAFTHKAVREEVAPVGAVEAPSRADVLARAVEHQDIHALKFAEACAREHAIREDPIYLLAARRVLDRLPAW